MRRAIIGGGAIVGGAAGGGYRSSTAAASKEQDARVLNLVLALEYTEAAFYREALERGASRASSRSTPKIVARAREGARRVPQAGAGQRGRPAPRHDFGDKTKDANAFTAAAVKLEDLAVATYNGQAVNLTPAALKAAARIVSVEARHAAWIRSIVGQVPADGGDGPGISEAETRAQTERLRLEGGMRRMDFLLDDLDTDGALRETGENAGISRAAFLGGTLAGAVAAFASPRPPRPQRAATSTC